MDDICRLCCSTSFVNNYIFDEENALYLKMSLYLPIKVFKNDRLPQRVCDKCSCKVNDFYQFCNETIEVQQRLRAVLISSGVEVEDSIDLTLIKQNDLSPAPAFTEGFVHKVEPPGDPSSEHNGAPSSYSTACDPNVPPQTNDKPLCDQSTQTEEVNVTKAHVNNSVPEQWSQAMFPNVRVKMEPEQTPCKLEQEEYSPAADEGPMADPNYSDCSDDNLALSTISTIKRERKDLQQLLDESKHGVIYMSFGTNTKPSTLPAEKIQMFLNVFSHLPYDILCKWDKDELPGQTKNIKIAKWFPQADLLHTLTEAKLEEAIELIIGNESFKSNVAKLRSLMMDQPESALERAVRWTEYVLRHSGAKHLRSPAANISWAHYYEIELVGLVFVSLAVMLLCMYVVLRCIVMYVLVTMTKIKKD